MQSMTCAVCIPVLYNGQCHYSAKLKSHKSLQLNCVRWDLVDSLYYTTGNVFGQKCGITYLRTRLHLCPNSILVVSDS